MKMKEYFAEMENVRIRADIDATRVISKWEDGMITFDEMVSALNKIKRQRNAEFAAIEYLMG